MEEVEARSEKKKHVATALSLPSESELEKQGFKVGGAEEGDFLQSTHMTMPGSLGDDALDEGVSVPAFLQNAGLFDTSDMRYRKQQREYDLQREIRRKESDDLEIRSALYGKKSTETSVLLRAAETSQVQQPTTKTKLSRKRRKTDETTEKVIRKTEDKAKARGSGLGLLLAAYDDDEEHHSSQEKET